VEFEMKEVRVDWVRVTDRSRKKVGDVTGLAASIREIGLIHPITVTEGGTLLVGERRLEAYRLLGRETIPARVVSELIEAIERLRIERDENTEREAMTPEELVSLGLKLEALERPSAAERRLEGNARGGRAQVVGEFTDDLKGARDTREIVGNALGWAGSTYGLAKAVVAAAHDADAPPERREVAQAALAEMNATGKVWRGFRKLKEEPAAATGARQRPVIGDAKKQRHAITQAASTLTGIAMGFGRINAIHPDITSEEAAQWVGDLSEARRAIEQLIKRLKELTNAQA